MTEPPGTFYWMHESMNVIEILEYDYKWMGIYSNGYGWTVLKEHVYRTPFCNKYGKIRDHMWPYHTDTTFGWSMNIMEFVAKVNWNEMVKYTKQFPGWYIY